ncbi:hypothetical protein DFH07DRAFT_1064492 [Mycena maculata]|uniref:DUF202 domain-containing protein n=1 Tax=Mycena maculata TaxID=230809 RepID=A0AAD7IAR2_9AGAR|nr:hypothetical protein DFH07DRAFT_1064492 [Mycena maculata]
MSRITPSTTPPLPHPEMERDPNLHTPLLNPSDANHGLPIYTDGDACSSGGRTSYRSSSTGLDRHCGVTVDNPLRSSMRVSLILENSGSVARDHLASERTFLAYVRTSLTIASAGVALAQLLTLSERFKNQISVPLQPFETYARPLAVGSIVLALYVLLVGVSRYFTVQTALTKGLFPVTRFHLGFIAFFIAAIITVVFGLLIAERTRAQ